MWLKEAHTWENPKNAQDWEMVIESKLDSILEERPILGAPVLFPSFVLIV
jgi:hypothetical protein